MFGDTGLCDEKKPGVHSAGPGAPRMRRDLAKLVRSGETVLAKFHSLNRGGIMMKCWPVASARTASADRVTARPDHGLRCMAALLAVAAWVWLAASPAQAQTPGAVAVGVKVEQMLKATSFTYKTHNPITWSIEFERKTIGKFRVIISNNEDIIVTFTTVTEKAKIRKTPQLMEALLSANHEYDYAKIGLDKDGDLFVRIDSPVRVTDSALLKSIIEQVANASGEIFTKNASFLKR